MVVLSTLVLMGLQVAISRLLRQTTVTPVAAAVLFPVGSTWP